MPPRRIHETILALLVATALATAPALSKVPGDSPWHLRPTIAPATWSTP